MKMSKYYYYPVVLYYIPTVGMCITHVLHCTVYIHVWNYRALSGKGSTPPLSMLLSFICSFVLLLLL